MAQLSNIITDYESIRQAIQDDLLQNSPTFTATYPSETSSILTNMLAGPAALWNHKIEQATLNLFLDSATGYKTLYALAQSLGYQPANKQPATAYIRINLEGATSPMNIPAGTKFIINGFEYYNKLDYSTTLDDEYIDLVLTQGTTVTQSFTAIGESFETLQISSDYKVLDGTVKVLVNNVLWTYAGTSFFETNSYEECYTVLNSSEGYTQVIFGNNVFGRVPPVGANIVVEYRECVGPDANTSSVGDTVTSDAISFPMETISPIEGGKSQEDLSDIKFTANKLAFTDNNTKLIGRNDFKAYIYRAYDVLDVNVWGAYEETQRIQPDPTQMNRIYFSIIPSTYELNSDSLGNGNGTTTNSFTVPDADLPVVPGSIRIVAGNESFKDLATGYIVSELTTTSVLANPDSTYCNTGTNADYAFDNDVDNYYESTVSPKVNNPIRIGAKYDTPVSISAYRLRSAPVDPEYAAVPEQFDVYISHESDPDFTNEDDWIKVDSQPALGLTMGSEWSRWITIPHTTNVTAFKLVVFSATTSGMKIAEIQAVDNANLSTINYDTGAITLYSEQAIATTTEVTMTDLNFVANKLVTDSIAQDLTDRTLFTTLIDYRAPKAVNVTVYIDVYYNSSANPPALKSQIEQAIQDYFKSSHNMFARKIPTSDILNLVLSIDGVDYAMSFKPTDNIILMYDEFPVLSSLTVNMKASVR